MNHRESPHHRREALSCLAVLFLAPAGAVALPRASSSNVNSSNPPNTTTYLPVVGAPQLRFQPKPFVAEPVSNPPVASSATPPAAASASGGDFIIPKLHVPAAQTAEPPPVATTNNPAPPAAKPPPAIIQDDLRPAVRAEDFLPYFQMPGSARNPGDVTVITPVPKGAPAPAPIPPSSATYTQTPK